MAGPGGRSSDSSSSRTSRSLRWASESTQGSPGARGTGTVDGEGLVLGPGDRDLLRAASTVRGLAGTWGSEVTSRSETSLTSTTSLASSALGDGHSASTSTVVTSRRDLSDVLPALLVLDAFLVAAEAGRDPRPPVPVPASGAVSLCQALPTET